MKIKVDENIFLELVDDVHVNELYLLAETNREHLKDTLGWLDFMQSADFIKNFVLSTKQKNKDEYEYAFVIFYKQKLVGRLGIYKIDKQNKIGEIGYWIGKEYQGLGIITKSSYALLTFAFQTIVLNRIELKCKTTNQRSINVAQYLNFKFEGIMREAEMIRDEAFDLNLYAILKKDFH